MKMNTRKWAAVALVAIVAVLIANNTELGNWTVGKNWWGILFWTTICIAGGYLYLFGGRMTNRFLEENTDCDYDYMGYLPRVFIALLWPFVVMSYTVIRAIKFATCKE